MQRYANLHGDSPVEAYDIGATEIRVRFRGAERVYAYTHASAGAGHVEAMKRLAEAGRGLATYITRHVADDYVR